MKDQYLISIRLIERLHRRFLDVIKAELDRLGIEDINNVQTLILFNINEEQLTVGELTVRGYYLGSNVSYNVKKLVELFTPAWRLPPWAVQETVAVAPVELLNQILISLVAWSPTNSVSNEQEI